MRTCHRLDLDTPLIGLLLGELKSKNDHGVDREPWEAAIELAAPGYLELEAQGRELEYDLYRVVHPRALTHDNFVGKIEWQAPDLPRLLEGSDFTQRILECLHMSHGGTK